jgi:hypothetical protein
MFVLELPSKSEAAGVRVAALGSCRVRNPFWALQDLGEVKVCDHGLSLTHGVGESRQALETVLGLREIAAEFSPYIYGVASPPQSDRLRRALGAGVDVFLLEVSAARQFSCGDVFLQQNFVSRELVQKHGAALQAKSRRRLSTTPWKSCARRGRRTCRCSNACCAAHAWSGPTRRRSSARSWR